MAREEGLPDFLYTPTFPTKFICPQLGSICTQSIFLFRTHSLFLCSYKFSWVFITKLMNIGMGTNWPAGWEQANTNWLVNTWVQINWGLNVQE